MELGHGYILSNQSPEFQAAVREHQRRARQAVNDTVHESSERYQAATPQEIEAL